MQMVWETSAGDNRQHGMAGVRGKVGLCPPMVSDIVGLLWWGGEDSCSIVQHICLVRLTALHDLPFYCTSTTPIQLTAGHCSSIALTVYSYAVALSGGPTAKVVRSWQ